MSVFVEILLTDVSFLWSDCKFFVELLLVFCWLDASEVHPLTSR